MLYEGVPINLFILEDTLTTFLSYLKQEQIASFQNFIKTNLSEFQKCS